MIQNHIKKKILEKARSLEKYGMNDLTWEKDEAKTLINNLLLDDIGILGGSVYKIDSNHLLPMYDNWSSNFEGNETRQEFYLKSKEKALDYIDNYPVYAGETILFSLVFTDDID